MIHCMKNIIRYVIPYGLQCRQYAIKYTMSQKPELYADEASPPVRFVMMTASLLDIELIINKVDLFAGEHKSQAYYKHDSQLSRTIDAINNYLLTNNKTAFKLTELFQGFTWKKNKSSKSVHPVENSEINPLQKVPALVIEDKTILDSHAAAIYLCQKAPAQLLYPIDPFERAKVNEMLFYNSSRLFPLDSEIISSYFAGNWPVPETKKDEWYDALDYLEINLNKNKWLVGAEMYLCDICVMLTVTSLQLLIPISERHINIKKWLQRFEALPCYEINRRGLERLAHFIELYKHK